MSHLRSRFGIFCPTVVLSLALALVGCASNPTPTPVPSANGETAVTAKAPAPAAKRSIAHAMGTTEIDGAPKRVITLEWSYAEAVLALGLQPVGNADNKGLKTWVSVTPELTLAESVTDVGTRQEPNLETIAALKPDLIIGVKYRHEKIYRQLEAIAPTLIFDPYSPENVPDQMREMQNTFLAIADATGRKAEGEAVLMRMNVSLDKAAADLKNKGKAGREFALVQAYTAQNVPQLRVFADNSMAAAILNRMGLKNAHKVTKPETNGFSTVSVEALPAMEKADFFYVVQETDNVFANQLKENPVWKGLVFVKENRTYPLGGNVWLFGGPLSAEVFAGKIVGLLSR